MNVRNGEYIFAKKDIPFLIEKDVPEKISSTKRSKSISGKTCGETSGQVRSSDNKLVSLPTNSNKCDEEMERKLLQKEEGRRQSRRRAHLPATTRG